MSNMFSSFLGSLRSLLTWWVTVAPWEHAIRVRCGKHVHTLQPGIHLRIPGFDRVYVQSVRMRAADLPLQTVTTADAKVITLAGVLQYSINDLRLLYDTLHHAEDTVVNIATAIIAEYAATHAFNECTPAKIQQHVDASIDLAQYGLGGAKCSIVDYAVVKTYRVIKDERRMGYGDSLSTNRSMDFGANDL
jgi:hypothetical protein